jgi:hypothetical protein
VDRRLDLPRRLEQAAEERVLADDPRVVARVERRRRRRGELDDGIPAAGLSQLARLREALSETIIAPSTDSSASRF